MLNLTFDDVLIDPKFSRIKSRKDVSLDLKLGSDLKLPVISANMDTVTGVEMAKAMLKAGAQACLHRFWTTEDNVKAFLDVFSSTNKKCFVSVGLGEVEFNRAEALYKVGARYFIIDVAHAAQEAVAEQYVNMKRTLKDSFVVVGNFGNFHSIQDFWRELNIRCFGAMIDAVKIGIGPGSACTTRIKTGVGVPQLSAILDVAEGLKNYLDKPLIIADGGMKNPGDIAKALAAGADCVMLGGMLAGTDETPGEVITGHDYMTTSSKPILPGEQEWKWKKYRGSASKEAYSDQGKDDSWRTAEGEAFVVACKGPVAQVLQDVEGGLRSAFTYVGARTIADFHERAKFLEVTPNCSTENRAHGKG